LAFSWMPWLILSAAILFEVAGTTSMKLSRGFAETAMWHVDVPAIRATRQHRKRRHRSATTRTIPPSARKGTGPGAPRGNRRAFREPTHRRL
jgi:hypothetical protein